MLDQLGHECFCESLPAFRVKMERVEEILGSLKKIERLFWQRKSRSFDHAVGKDRMICLGEPGKLCKRASRHGREHNCGGTIRITIQNPWNPITLQFEGVFSFRLRRLYQALTNGLSLSFS